MAHPDRSGCPRDLGLWKVTITSGGLAPHDALSRNLQAYVDSECNIELFTALFPTPTPIPSPTALPTPTFTRSPTRTPTPTPEPLIATAENAEAALWAYRVRCFRKVSQADLDATWDPRQLEWVVITAAGSTLDFGVWKVQRFDGTITPDNRQAKTRDSQVREERCM